MNDAEITKNTFENTQSFFSPTKISVCFNSFVFHQEVEQKEKKDKVTNAYENALKISKIEAL